MSSTTAGALPAQPSRKGLIAILALALFLALFFIAVVAFPYFAGTEENLTMYAPRLGWLYAHIGAGMVPLLIGPFQLWMGFTGRRLPLHRQLGMVYMGAILVSCAAAFYLAFNTDGGWVFGAGLASLAVAWLITTGMAYIAIRRRLLEQHKEWMIRSYVVTFAFVFFRILAGSLEAAEVGTLYERLAISAWFCWAVPLLITEAILQGRKVFARRAAA